MEKDVNKRRNVLRLVALGAVMIAFGFFLADCLNQRGWSGKGGKVLDREKVNNFALFDHEGNFQELYYYGDKRAVVIIAQGNGCPIIRKSIPYLNELKQKYEPYGIVFLMINANSQDDRFSIAEEAKAFNIELPILEDRSQDMAKSMKISRTAEAVFIDVKDWSVLYRGAISDGLGYESERIRIRHHYLRDAIEALLNNSPISKRQIDTKGCLINFDSSKENTEYTYVNHVAPILKKKCVSCHSKGGAAPWNMDNYQTVKGWGAMIREVVRTKRMPPWHADPYYGEFKNDIALNPDEVKALLGWIEQNYVRGNGADPLAATDRFPSDLWSLGKPDLKVKLKTPQEIPATGADEFRFIEGDGLVEEDIWIRAVDIQPGNRKVVHHGNLTVEWPAQNETAEEVSNDAKSRDKERWYQAAGLNMEKGAVIAGYAPGGEPFEMPEDTGIFVPKGSKFVFRMHYITTGRQETDLTEAGIYLHKTIPQKTLAVSTINNRAIRIGAGEKNYQRTGSFTFKNDAMLMALQPHMHYRGKSMKFVIEYPDGSLETALSVPNYRFHWQRRYVFKEPKQIPKGATIYLEGYYDNSSQNPDNPDPQQNVVYGPYSLDEMFQGILFYVDRQNEAANENAQAK